jgi:hypothetical protein
MIRILFLILMIAADPQSVSATTGDDQLSGSINESLREGTPAHKEITAKLDVVTSTVAATKVAPTFGDLIPELSETTKWVVALIAGVFLVGIYSWSRFDEPSYAAQAEYFARYKPRFSTSRTRYLRAKWGYTCSIVFLFIVLSLLPELVDALVGETKNVKGATGPLLVALAITTLQNAPVLRDLERKIRGFLHSFARIPDGIRRTVAELRSSQFDYKAAAVAAQTAKLGTRLDTGALDSLIRQDDVLNTWFKLGCVLYDLADQNRDRTGINSLFFEYYKDELDSINAKHSVVADLVRRYLATQSRTTQSTNDKAAHEHLVRSLRDLRDRLYTFVACGVRSSVKTDAEARSILQRLGFTAHPLHGDKFPIGALAGLSIIAVALVSLATAQLTQVFRSKVLEPLGPMWDGAFQIPKDTFDLYAWSWSTAFYYFAAIFGALAVRNGRISKREWFDVSSLKRSRPILRYMAPAIMGTILGYTALLVVAVLQGPAFDTSVPFIGALADATRGSVAWFPLGTVISLIVLLLTDSEMSNEGFWDIALRATCGGLVMAAVGYLIGNLTTGLGVEGFAHKHDLQVTADVSFAGDMVNLFVALLIGIFSAILCTIVQVVERSTQKTRKLAGRYLQAISSQGPMFVVFLEATGQASLYAANETELGSKQSICKGIWRQFPEGMVARWTTQGGKCSCTAGDLALITVDSESLIYEGYCGQISGAAGFIAQLRMLPG